MIKFVLWVALSMSGHALTVDKTVFVNKDECTVAREQVLVEAHKVADYAEATCFAQTQ